jgi:general L-amino acid transport system permease protein
VTAVSRPERYHARVAPWRDAGVLRVATQVVLVLAVAALLWFLAANLVSTMAERRLSFSLAFLERRAGFEIPDSPVPYSPSESYGQAYLVGLVNTLFLGVIGILLATLLGIVVGIARLSRNWLLNRVAAAYVEVMRNTPLLVQLFVIYFVVLLQLPAVRETIALPGSIFLNQRGLFVPAPRFGPSLAAWIGLLAVGVLFVVATRLLARRATPGTGVRTRLAIAGAAGFVVIAAAGWFLVGGDAILFDVPQRGRFNYTGGMALSTSFTALLLGLVIYTAAFIGEVVRGAIQAVRRGQWEAARALGLSEGDTLRLIVFPQAMRIIVPPLTSQYLNLVKNSSLAIAVGYPDLFKVGVTMSNQTGQPVPVVVLIMGTYLAISLGTSLLMNIYNRRVQVLER